MNIKGVLLVLISILIAACTAPQVNVDEKLDQALNFAGDQLLQSVESVQDSTKFPRTTKNNEWQSHSARDWTSGFFPGVLWYMYEYTQNDAFKAAAEKWTDGLYNIQFVTDNHDLGFMMYCSYGNGLRITENESYIPILLQTAESLAGRFNPTVGCIKSWDWMRPVEKYPYPVIIDNMMNLELLFWASKQSGDQKFYDIAIKHAEKTMQNHFRDDYSTYHVVQYDPQTGDVVSKHTHQGYADESCWTRGQAWGIYGFTMVYRETQDKRFLETAKKLTDYFIGRLPEDYVPYYDFDAPGIPDEPRDTAAGAIAASAMLELSKYCSNPADKAKYWDTAVHMLTSLAGPEYLAKGSGDPAILLHGTGSKPGNSEIDVPLIYGDYYFIEAILRYNAWK